MSLGYRFSTVLLTLFLFSQSGLAQRPNIVVTKEALDIHAEAPVIDGHNDLPWTIRRNGGGFSKTDIRKPQPDMHTDIARLKTGGVGAQFWSVYVPASTMKSDSALSTTLEQIELVKTMCETYPDVFELALTTADIDRIRKSGKIASMIGVEGGHSIENSINVLRQLYKQGARYMTLTHSVTLDWADSCSDAPKSNGLSKFGEEVVAEMNRMGMLVDISHVSAKCMRDVLAVTKAPVIFSHSSAYAKANHPRNVPDDVLKLTAKNGGVVMINFFNDYVNPVDATRSEKRSAKRKELEAKYGEDSEQADTELSRWEKANPRSTLSTVHDVVDHVDHIAKLVGVEHVGMGSDYDGVPVVPKQLEDVSTYPVITQGLLDRGYNAQQIKQIMGGNVLRAFRQTEAVAKELAASK